MTSPENLPPMPERFDRHAQLLADLVQLKYRLSPDVRSQIKSADSLVTLAEFDRTSWDELGNVRQALAQDNPDAGAGQRSKPLSDDEIHDLVERAGALLADSEQLPSLRYYD